MKDPEKSLPFSTTCVGLTEISEEEALYDQGRTVERLLTQGAKILYFESGNLIFKDSVNFFAMALD